MKKTIRKKNSLSNKEWLVLRYLKRFTLNGAKGFTLIELLAVVLVFVLISGMGTVILITSLRTTTKTNTLTNVKQNGNFAISQMTKIIRDSTGVVNPNPCTIAVFPTPIPTITSITVATSTGTQATFSCSGNSITYATTANPTPQQFLDTGAVTATSCGFTCSQTTVTDYPVIGISFSITSATTNGVVENTTGPTPIQFSTNITLRNKNR